jgi:hypothetical protein
MKLARIYESQTDNSKVQSLTRFINTRSNIFKDKLEACGFVFNLPEREE